MLDFWMMRRLRSGVVGALDAAITEYISIFVKIGLVLLWITGIALIAYHPEGPPGALANPKLQAKLVIVVTLTLNALLIEGIALPIVVHNRGRHLFHGLSFFRRSLVLTSGAVSAASWVVPFMLGKLKEWNNGAVPAFDILAGWIVFVVLGSITMIALSRAFDLMARQTGIPDRDLVSVRRLARTTEPAERTAHFQASRG